MLEQLRKKRRDADITAVDIDILGEDENVYAQNVDAGHGMDRRARKIMVVCISLVALYVLALIVPKEVFAPFSSVDTAHPLSLYVTDLSNNIAGIVGVLTGLDNAAAEHVASGMVRYVVIALAGAGLALSGAIYQGSFRNALVSPSTLGVMTGGQFGLTVWVLVMACTGHEAVLLKLNPPTAADGQQLQMMDYVVSSYGLALASFVGCFIVVGLVLLTLRIAGSQRLSGIMLIIAGQVIGSVVGVFGTLVRYYYVSTDPWGAVAGFLQEVAVASFYRQFTWIDILCLGVPLVVTFVVVMLLARKMMVLSFDRTEQRSLGIDTGRIRFVVVALCTLLTAFVISFCGAVGFVGFLVPHLARRLVGPDFKYLLPASTAIGAVFVLGAYVIVEVFLGTGYLTMTGMFISMGGAVVFLVTALRGKGAANGAFVR